MGNCINGCCPASNASKQSVMALPIDTTFKLPAPLPTWPSGKGFTSGTIDLGGLEVCQISTFHKVWATHEGGPDNLGATFFEPSSVPDGFFMLGCYSQPNNRALFGWVLAGKDTTDDHSSDGSLKFPSDYTLIWSSNSLRIKQDGAGYIWQPVPPDGYRAVGYVVTTSPEKPPLDKIQCIRSDFTDACENDAWIWSPGKNVEPNGISIFSSKPGDRGVQALSVPTGTFVVQTNGAGASLACLKNLKGNLSSMPNLSQIQALFQNYSPWIYFHPNEKYLPSSVPWFFQNGALLYTKGKESNPVGIEPNGSNLPQGGSNDGAYWIDLPKGDAAKNTVKKGDLNDATVYLHIKPMLGGTFTDIAMWVFYPFNGPARAKIEFFTISLGKIGEHVGDWEHVTLRISNFNGELKMVYFSEHSGGSWKNASELEFQNGNKPVTYASLHGHALYSKPGVVLQGSGNIGIRNDTAKSKMVLDSGSKFQVAAAGYLGSENVEEPPWLDYAREWGPKISYDIADEIKKVEKLLPGKLKRAFEKLMKDLPQEVLGEEGPLGPKWKNNWNGDER